MKPSSWFVCGFVAGCAFTFVALLATAAIMSGAEVPWPQAAAPQSGDARVSGLLAPIQAIHHVPALGAAVVRGDGLLAAGTVGWRHLGEAAPATIDDAWHIGSDAKAMTAMLAAIAVSRGRLRWDSTLSEVFPDLAADCAPGWSTATLDHLLCHRAGAAANLGAAKTERLMAVRHMTSRPRPEGDNFAYSNLGYIAVGAMLERAMGAPWEQLIATQLWEPLGMHGCGFGGMGTPGRNDGIWGHDAEAKPMGNGVTADNPLVLGPAGTVHLPLVAWAAFIADQLRGAQGRPALLPTAFYQHLHTPWPGGDYARGWSVVTRPWAHGVALTHAGSNTMHHAVVWLAPAIDRAFLVTANRNDADAACDAAVAALLGAWPAGGAPP